MSRTDVQARICGDEADLGRFDTITLYGHELTEDFQSISVEEDVLAKLKGNPHVEVRETEPKPRRAKADPKPQAEPEAAPAAEEPTPEA